MLDRDLLFSRIDVINGQKIINGNVYITKHDLDIGTKQLPDLSDVIIKGNYYCYLTRVGSLKGAPAIVEGEFLCGTCELTNLIGAPKVIGEDFGCAGNLNIRSLKGAPEYIGGKFISDHFTHDQYLQYMEDLTMIESLNSESRDLFANLITDL